ncbi:MAG: AIPR family protein, partial [Terriglobia bacterium]
QSAVQPAALHATEKIQHDIEQILAQHDWYYERRTNYFRNSGKPEHRIVTPLFIASGVVALLLKNPVAAVLRQKHIRGTEAYDAVFSPDHPIEAWSVVVQSLKLAEAELLRTRSIRGGARPRYLANWRGLLAFLVVARHFKTFYYSSKDLANLKIADLPEQYFAECWALIKDDCLGRTKANFTTVEKACATVSVAFQIHGDWLNARKQLPPNLASMPIPMQRKERRIEPEVLNAVNQALPPQPWKPGMAATLATSLKLHPGLVSNAIQELIRLGKWNQQRDGVVYDRSGKILATDPDRVPAPKS